MAPVLVHPDVGHPQSVPTHEGCQVGRVGFVGALDVCNPGAGQDLHAAAALPHLCCTHINTHRSATSEIFQNISIGILVLFTPVKPLSSKWGIKSPLSLNSLLD